MAGEHHYTPQDIRAILKSCRESGVTRLQIGAFSVSFLSPEPKTPEVATPTPEEIRSAKEYESQVFASHEKRIREEELSNLRLSDPEAYEDLVNRGELNAREESDRADT